MATLHQAAEKESWLESWLAERLKAIQGAVEYRYCHLGGRGAQPGAEAARLCCSGSGGEEHRLYHRGALVQDPEAWGVWL